MGGPGPGSVVAVLLVVIFAVVFVGGAAQAPSPFAVRISCGSLVDYATSEHSWSKDYGYSGGSVGNLSTDLAGTTGLTTLRYFSSADGPNNCYNISVPSGHYLIRFFFGYGQADNGGREPQFDVSVEGTLGFALKPGWSSIDDTRYADALIFIDDNAAMACFHSTGHGNPAVVTLEIMQLYENAYDQGFGPQNHKFLLIATARVSCGATKPAYGTDLGADPWGGDRYWSQDVVYIYEGISVSSLSTLVPIRNTNIPPNFYPEKIYQGATITTGAGTVSYAFPIEPSQNYSIWLHFAEIDTSITAAGQRVFNVLYNDRMLYQNVDIWTLAGGANAAVVLNQTVLVDGKTLTLTFEPVQGDILVSAIEVYQIMERELPTQTQEVWALQAMKPNLGIPPRMGWIGDPCVPQQHPWDGIDCRNDNVQQLWLIDGLVAEFEGLKGVLTDDFSALTSIDHINLKNNFLQGPIPASLGNLTSLTILDLSNNQLNGSIPESLGTLTKLTELYLNDNQLTGRVPASLAAGPVRGVSFNFLGNPGLCGIPGLRSCNQLSTAQIAGIVIGVLLVGALVVGGGYILWKRKENLARANKILMAGDAPYAAAHTNTRTSGTTKDVQLSRFGSFTEQRLMRADSNNSVSGSPRV
ncbi:unnamed protein product [Calypogeia fissa]